MLKFLCLPGEWKNSAEFMISQQFEEKNNRFKTIVVKNFNQSPKSQQVIFCKLNGKDINRIRERWKLDNAHSLPYSRNDSYLCTI